MRTLLCLLAVGCAPKVTIESDPLPAPKSEDADDDDGPIAGPRNIVQQAPPDPLPADTPDVGPLQVYVAQVRVAVGERLKSCLGDEAVEHGALLARVTVGPDGGVQNVEVVKSSGNEKYDGCVVRAFRTSRLPAPSIALRGDQPVLALPDIAFR